MEYLPYVAKVAKKTDSYPKVAAQLVDRANLTQVNSFQIFFANAET